jgi:Cdc6-like AAA superfamily ATPase
MDSSGMPESPDMMVRFLQSGEVFTPSAPIDNQALFAGRVSQLNTKFIRVRLQQQTANAIVIIIIDEMDRLRRDSRSTALMADTIKTLSDHSVNTTLILVGVGNSVEELITEHLSIERSLIQIQMLRMSSEELNEILLKGLKILSMIMDKDVTKSIVFLSQGLPNYVHLLALYGCQAAIRENDSNINTSHLSRAIKQACENAQQSIMSAYSTSVSSSRKEMIYPKVLLACALANKDETGCFRAIDV